MRSLKTKAAHAVKSFAETAAKSWRAARAYLKRSRPQRRARGFNGAPIEAGMRVDNAYGGFDGAVTVVQVLRPDAVELEYEDGVREEAFSSNLLPWAGPHPDARHRSRKRRRRETLRKS